MLDQRRDLRTSHHQRLLLVSCRPDSSLRAAEDPAGSTSAAVAARTVLREGHTGLVAAHSQDLAGMGWASRSSRCCWADPAGTAACPGCMGQHRGELAAATGDIAEAHPALQLVSCYCGAIYDDGCRDMWRRKRRRANKGAGSSADAEKV